MWVSITKYFGRSNLLKLDYMKLLEFFRILGFGDEAEIIQK